MNLVRKTGNPEEELLIGKMVVCTLYMYIIGGLNEYLSVRSCFCVGVIWFK